MFEFTPLDDDDLFDSIDEMEEFIDRVLAKNNWEYIPIPS